MKKPILISLIAVGGAALAAGAVYLVKKLRSPEYYGEYDDYDDDCCCMDGPEETESIETQESTEPADGEEGP